MGIDEICNEKKARALQKMKEVDARRIECPECEIGTFGGLFWHSCTNPKCLLYNSYASDRCLICDRPRTECAC